MGLKFLRIVFAIPMVLPLGCGQGGARLYPVQGQALVKGKPAAGAVLVFHPVAEAGAEKPAAVVDEGGAFQVATRQPGDGAPAGEYRVTVTWLAHRDIDPEKGDATQADVDRLGGRYADPETSPLRVTVREDTNELPPFELR